jgi:CheY-like chemotaxis protein
MTAGGTVLVVEDDHDILEIVTAVLEDGGYRVLPASDAQLGLDLLRTARPGLVLLDLRMPGMSGHEFRAAQLRDPALAAIPVVLLSADASVGEIAHSLRVAGWLRKPLDLDALYRIVAKECLPSTS